MIKRRNDISCGTSMKLKRIVHPLTRARPIPPPPDAARKQHSCIYIFCFRLYLNDVYESCFIAYKGKGGIHQHPSRITSAGPAPPRAPPEAPPTPPPAARREALEAEAPEPPLPGAAVVLSRLAAPSPHPPPPEVVPVASRLRRLRRIRRHPPRRAVSFKPVFAPLKARLRQTRTFYRR